MTLTILIHFWSVKLLFHLLSKAFLLCEIGPMMSVKNWAICQKLGIVFYSLLKVQCFRFKQSEKWLWLRFLKYVGGRRIDISRLTQTSLVKEWNGTSWQHWFELLGLSLYKWLVRLRQWRKKLPTEFFFSIWNQIRRRRTW